MKAIDQKSLFEQFHVFEIPLESACDISLFPKNFNVQTSVDKMRVLLQSHEKVMCSISGGWDSDIMLDLTIRCGGREKSTFCFFDTGLEYDATKEHIRYLEDTYRIKIKVLHPKKAIPTCCREYGVPFWSKFASEMIHRLQRNGFQWENESLDALFKKYPKCKAALRWWCNEWGENSKFNIGHVNGLKEFILENPPQIFIAKTCCQKAKKDPAADEEKNGYDLICTGVRKAEGGTRSTGFHSCFDQKFDGADYYRPLFWWTDQDKEQYTRFFNITRSDCYEVWGMDRTGCAGCPFGKNFEQELDLVQQYEPKRYQAINAIFGESYEYTRQFMAFREKMKLEKREEKARDIEQISMEGF